MRAVFWRTKVCRRQASSRRLFSSLSLRPYQTECIEASVKAVERGIKSQAVSLPVGSGKTVVFSHLVERMPSLSRRAHRTLVLAHRDEIIDQAVQKICKIQPHLIVDIEQGKKRPSSNADVIVASVATLGRRDSPRLVDDYDPNDFKLIIIDEAHHAAASTYRRILRHFGRGGGEDENSNSNVLVWGCSATLARHDGVRLSDVFDEITYYRTLLDMWNDGWLSPARAYHIKTNVNLSDVPLRSDSGDFNITSLADRVDTPHRNELITRAWERLSSPRQRSTLVFAVDVRHVANLVEAFRSRGVDARGVVGSTSKDERVGALEAFKRGDFPVLVNCQVFTEGTDVPRVDCVVLARPTASPVLFQQMLGRGLRLFPGKVDCVVLDCVDVCARRTLVTLPSLLGLVPHFDMGGLDAWTVYRRMERLVDETPECVEAGSLVEARNWRESDFELESADLRVDDFKRAFPDRLDWIRLRKDVYGLIVLKAGQLIVIGTSTGEYRYGLYLKSSESKDKFSCLGQFGDLESAFKGASTYVRRCSYTAWKLADKNAEWKRKPASEGQLRKVKTILKRKLQEDRVVTKGFASYIIGAMSLRQTLKQLELYLSRPPARLTPLFAKEWKTGSLIK